jgi:hypothetical protein
MAQHGDKGQQASPAVPGPSESAGEGKKGGEMGKKKKGGERERRPVHITAQLACHVSFWGMAWLI